MKALQDLTYGHSFYGHSFIEGQLTSLVNNLMPRQLGERLSRRLDRDAKSVLNEQIWTYLQDQLHRQIMENLKRKVVRDV